MAELTNAPFRRLVAEIGGCDVFYTEMINSRIASTQPLDRDPFCQRIPRGRSLVAQIVGNDPDKMALSASLLEERGFSGIDINMGCSRRALVRRGWGAALPESPKVARKVVEAVRAKVSVPLTVKLRSGLKGHDLPRLLRFARMLEDLGVDGLVLHPRAGSEGFKREARWSEIAELVSSLSIPVVGNGDVTTPVEAFAMAEETGCAGVMIGRAALVRPWIFFEASERRPWRGSVTGLVDSMAAYCSMYLPGAMASKGFYLFLSWLLRNWRFHHFYLKGLAPTLPVDENHGRIREVLGKLGPASEQAPFCARL